MQIRSDGSILLSVASYRDDQCPLTVADAFAKAKHPELLYAAIVQQNDEDKDKDCKFTAEVLPQFKSHLRILRLHHLEAKGPCHARYLASLQYAGESFFCQIDR